LVVAAGAAAALLLGGGGLLAWNRGQVPVKQPRPEPEPAAPVLPPPPVVPAAAKVPAPVPTPVEPPPAEPARPVLPATVTVQVESVPPGASVSSGGEVLGTAPLLLDLMRGGIPRALEFKLAGHETVTASVSAQNAPALKVELPVRREPKRPAPPPLDLGIKTGR